MERCPQMLGLYGACAALHLAQVLLRGSCTLLRLCCTSHTWLSQGATHHLVVVCLSFYMSCKAAVATRLCCSTWAFEGKPIVHHTHQGTQRDTGFHMLVVGLPMLARFFLLLACTWCLWALRLNGKGNESSFRHKRCTIIVPLEIARCRYCT